MLWDDETQEYCKYKNGKGHGDWRAPEEYADKPLNEKIDVWSIGNNIYSVLTGTYPFYNVEDDKDIQVNSVECWGTVSPSCLCFAAAGLTKLETCLSNYQQ